MSKKIFIFLAALGVSGVAGLLSPVAGQQKYIADKVVAVVGGAPILYSEVVAQAERITQAYREQNYTSPRDPMAEALELLLEQKLLYQQAQIDSIGLESLAPNIAQAVEGDVDNMVLEAGSIKALETERNKPVYAIKEQMRADYEEYYGAMEMRNHVTGQVKITPGEVDRFFRRIDPDSLPIVPEQYVYAQITRLPKSNELAKQRTRDRLLNLRQRIIDGERFDNLARSYSVDPGSAMRGGELAGPIGGWAPPFAEALTKLQPGQISSVVETEYGFHIIQLIDKPAGDNYHFRHILLKPVYTDEELSESVGFLDSLVGVIRKGEITFEEAALKHSDDKDSRMNGGVVSNQQMLYRIYGNSSPSATSTRFIKDELEQTDAVRLIRMKEGEISAAFVGRDLNMDQMGKVLRLVQIVPAHKANLSEDWLQIEGQALTRKQGEHYKKWLDGKIDGMYVRIDPMFSRSDFDNKRWFK